MTRGRKASGRWGLVDSLAPVVVVLVGALLFAVPATAVPNDPALLEFDATSYTASESAASDTITVRRSGDTSSTVSVDVTTVDGTATAGVDYTATSGTLTFVGGDTSEQIVVPFLEDALIEGDEAFSLVLSNPTGGAVLSDQTTTVVTIDDNDDETGFLEFSRTSYTEPESDPFDTITVRRFGGSGGTVTVDVTTVDGTATAGQDYTATSGTLTFVGGDTSEQIFVPFLEDALIEGDEAFSLVLSNPTGGAVLSDQTTTVVTIDDNDDETGFLEFSRTSYTEPESDPFDTITVRRFGGSGGTVTVDVTTVDGTATAGQDYTAVSGTLTFVPGDASENIFVPFLEDALIEGDEAFSLVLSNPTGGAVLSDQTTTVVTIDDNDDETGFLEFSGTSYTEPESDPFDTITVRRFGGSGGTVTVDYTTVDGTATAGQDYTATSGTLTFVGGDTSEQIFVPFLEDGLIEGDEAFSLVLSNPTGGAVLSDQTTTVVTIDDNESFAGDISVSGRTVAEDGAANTMPITRGGAAVGAVSVDYAVVDLTAVNGADFSMVASGTVSWADGESGSKTVDFTPTDDALVEGVEYFQVVLSNPTGGATLDDTRIAKVTINDDEQPAGLVYVSGKTVAEDVAPFPPQTVSITRDTNSGGAVSVDYAVVDLNAVNGTDYSMVASGTVSWADGESGSKTVDFTPTDDALVEGVEYFQVVLSNPTGGASLYALGSRIAKVTINDDEQPAGLVYVSGKTVAEDVAPFPPQTVSITRDTNSGGAVSVDYAVVDLNAVNGTDYSMVASGTVSWADGESGSKTVDFTPTDDALVEGVEYFQVVLSNPTGGASLYALGSRIAKVTINDDEQPAGLVYVSGKTVAEDVAPFPPQTVSITRDTNSGGAVSVDYAVVDLNAVNGTDYSMVASGTVSWADGESGSKTVDFTPTDDALVEGVEYFQVVLSNPTGGASLYALGSRIAKVTINDDELGEAGAISLASGTSSADEDDGPMVFTVQRLAGSSGAASVDYDVTGGSATAGVDFTAVSGTLTWIAGDFSDREVFVPLLDDGDIEGPEDLTVTLSNFTGAAAGSITAATGTIVDDDGSPGTCDGLTVTVDVGAGDSPTEGDDVILGTNGPDDIDGLGGNDTICGLDGDDVLAGGLGDDTILGGGGNDTLKGQQDDDTLFGGPGDDLILGNAGDDVGFGEAGIDDLKGGSGIDTLDGGADPDEVRGGSGDDTLTGGTGDDVLNGGQDKDTVSGGIGDDVVNGAGSSDPSLNGDEGNDLVRGGNAGDVLNGGPGNDQLLGVLGADTLNGGPGDDDLRGGDGTDDVNGDEGDDDLRGGNGTDDCDGGVGGEVLGDEHLGGCETITNIP